MNSSLRTVPVLPSILLPFLLSSLPFVHAQETSNLVGARLFKSGPIQVTGDGKTVWAVLEDHNAVSRMDTETFQVKQDIPVGEKPRGLAVLADGSEIWVACHDSDEVIILSGNGDTLDRITMAWGSGPHSVAISPDETTALVTLHRASGVAVIDVVSRKITKVLEPLFWSPTGIAWTHDGREAWITHLFAPGEHPFLTGISFRGDAPKVMASLRMTAADPRNSEDLSAPFDIAEGGYLTMRGHPAQIPRRSGRNELWLPIQYHNITERRYSPDSTMQSSVRHIDLTNRKLLHSNEDKVILSAKHVHDPLTGGNPYQGPGWDAGVSGPIDIAFSIDGAWALMLHEVSNDLLIFPSGLPAVKPPGSEPLQEIRVGDRPVGLAFSPSKPEAYVLNMLSRDISVIDLAAKQESRRVSLVSSEPLPPQILSGAKLFHTSDDLRVSANSKVGCASCHINAEHDGRTWAFHRLPGPHGPRSVPSLLGLNRTFGPRDQATGWGQLHRSGDRDEIQDFEHTFRNPNMGGTGFLGENIHPELGAPNAGKNDDLDAIAQYLLSLKPPMRSPFRNPEGSLSEAAVRGAAIFLGKNRETQPADAGCAECHIPESGFVDFKFHDVGQRRDGTEEELNNRSPQWHVNTPTLIGLWATPPFGGVERFLEAVSVEANMIESLKDFAERADGAYPHGFPDQLTDRQLRDLATFVLSIDGNMTADEVRNARDLSPPYMTRVSPASLNRLEVWFNESVDKISVETTANWRLEELGGENVPVAITSVHHNAKSGDRVSLMTELKPNSRYRLSIAGSILDMADRSSGGTANAADLDAEENSVEFELGSALTISLGASSQDHLMIRVHDSAMVGPGLSTWNHDSVWLYPVDSGPGMNSGFVRFDWRQAFMDATGVAEAEEILDARFRLEGDFGSAASILIRRVLQRWSDPLSGNDWNRNATGAPTWRDHSHPSGRWNQAGAGRLGGSGSTVADYNGSNDLASVADAFVSMDAVNEEIEFASDKVTEAFRFWFDNPGVDYGYALQFNARSVEGAVKFHRSESTLNQHSARLFITYQLAGSEPPPLRLKAEREGTAVRISWPISVRAPSLQRSEDVTSGWRAITVATSVEDGWNVLLVPSGSDRRFYRLVAD